MNHYYFEIRTRKRDVLPLLCRYDGMTVVNSHNLPFFIILLQMFHFLVFSNHWSFQEHSLNLYQQMLLPMVARSKQIRQGLQYQNFSHLVTTQREKFATTKMSEWLFGYWSKICCYFAWIPFSYFWKFSDLELGEPFRPTLILVFTEKPYR